MAYDILHGPSCNSMDIGGHAPREWSMSGTDAAAAVAAAGYISDGASRGMRIGDTLLYRQTGVAPNLVTRMEVLTVNAATGVVDLSDGTQLSTTNAG